MYFCTQQVRALWGKAIKSEALREETIFRLSQCKGVPEAMKEVMAPLFKNKKADFKEITNVEIAQWLLQTLRLKKLPGEGHLKRELGNIRPARKK